jgi:hypothetical protein
LLYKFSIKEIKMTEDTLPVKMEVLKVLSEELDNFHLSVKDLKVLSESRIFRELMLIAIAKFFSPTHLRL